MSETYTLITGASSGFGRSIAQRLAPSRRLILVGRNAERLELTRSKCEAPERHLLWARDLSRLEGIGDELAVLLETKEIIIDHFVHSAGVLSIQYARAVEMTSVKQLFNVNVFSAMEIIRPLTQKKVNHGALRSVTFISSIATRVGAAGYSIYGASKGAVNSLSLSLAVELAPAVRVNAVLPGIVGTEMNTEHFANPEFVDFVRKTHPLGLGQPEDVADAVEFLASNRARWITGQEIVVDGGRTVFSPPRS
ncbi:MAG TPA: SDR family oxidoreductase [Verrucomicrobiae bacterium]|nr:SDR family oxidoreductase [Verrucomicrobiae bacterium]